MTLRKSKVSESLSVSRAFVVHLVKKKVPSPQTIPLALQKYCNGRAIKKNSTAFLMVLNGRT